jgi:hypothetical protein
MLFMVVEKIRNGDGIELYRRMAEVPTELPEGLSVVHSWIEPSFQRCFQVMECDDASKFQQWILSGSSIVEMVELEIVPIVTAGEARENVGPYLKQLGFDAPPNY